MYPVSPNLLAVQTSSGRVSQNLCEWQLLGTRWSSGILIDSKYLHKLLQTEQVTCVLYHFPVLHIFWGSFTVVCKMSVGPHSVEISIEVCLLAFTDFM